MSMLCERTRHTCMVLDITILSFYMCGCLCMCLPLRSLVTIHMHDKISVAVYLLNKYYIQLFSLLMAHAINIMDEYGLSNGSHHERLPKETEVTLY